MGPGIGLVKAGGLTPFCESFNAAGYATITLDYQSFGGSEGTPRNVLSVGQQLQDFRDIIAWVRSNPSFDNTKIVAWGTSFGGMHATMLISEDHGLAAAIAQCPCVDGFTASLMLPIFRSLRLTTWAILDTIGSVFGLGPTYVATADDGTPGLPVAILSAPDVPEGWARLMPEDGSKFVNNLAARSLWSVLSHRPVLHVKKSTKPFLVVATDYDTVAPLKAAERAARDAPFGELVRVKGGHFDVYKGGLGFEANLKAQLEFLKRVVPVAKSQQ